MRRAVLILSNPFAGRGPGAVRAAVQRVHEALDADASTEWVVTSWATDFTVEPRRDEVLLVREWLEAFDAGAFEGAPRILIASGDGGVAKAVLALSDRPDLRARVEFGVLPMGNANALAREIGLCVDDPRAATEQLLRGVVRPFDVGTLDGEPRFLLMLDIGYFAQVVRGVHLLRRWAATRWIYALAGDLVYGVVGVLELLRWWPARFELKAVADDSAGLRRPTPLSPGTGPAKSQAPHSPQLTGVGLAIANVPLYAKHFSLCPDADPTDGRLAFHLLPSVWRMPSYLHQAMTRQMGSGTTARGEGTDFVVTARGRAFRCQVDGDPLPGGPRTTLRLGVAPGFFRLLAPAPE